MAELFFAFSRMVPSLFRAFLDAAADLRSH